MKRQRRGRNEAHLLLLLKPKSRNSMIRTALAPRTTRSGKVFDNRRYSTLKNLSNLITKNDEVTSETTKRLPGIVDETTLDQNNSTTLQYEEENAQNINCQHENPTLNAGQKLIIIDGQNGDKIVDDQKRDANVIVNSKKENIKKHDKKNVCKAVKKKKDKHVRLDYVHPSLILLPKIPCIKNPIRNEKSEKTVRWADDELGNDGLSQVKEFEEQKPRRRCTMFHKVNG